MAGLDGRAAGAALSAVVAAALLAACSPQATRDDTGPAQHRRQAAIDRLHAGDHGFDAPKYQILNAKPLMVFFVTWTGFSPDPYCGYEYAEPPTPVDPDPLGSGEGHAEDLGNGWYWLCAT